MRGSAAVERAGEHKRIAGRPEHIARLGNQASVRSHVCALPMQDDVGAVDGHAGRRRRGARKKLDDTKRREIAEAVISGRKTAAQMARMFGVSPPTVSRIVAAHVAAGAH